MSNKDIVKHYYEVIVSKNLLDDLPLYISENCVMRVGENEYSIGAEGMRQHLVSVKKT